MNFTDIYVYEFTKFIDVGFKIIHPRQTHPLGEYTLMVGPTFISRAKSTVGSSSCVFVDLSLTSKSRVVIDTMASILGRQSHMDLLRAMAVIVKQSMEMSVS